MARFKVTGPTGRTVVLEGDTPPTEADLDGIFASLPPPKITPSERLKTAAVYGLLPAAAGARKEEMDRGLVDAGPDIYQGAGNVMGEIVAGPPGAAYAGSLMRGAGNVMRDISSGGKPTVESFRKGATAGATSELIGTGIVKGLERAVPAGKAAARRIVQSIIKPTLKQLEENPEMMDTALKAGYGGTKYNMYDKSVKRIRQLGQQVQDILEKNSTLKGLPENAVAEMDKLAKNYEDSVDSQSADFVRKLRDQYVEKLGLKKPVYGEVEKGAFEMGGGSITLPKKVVLEKNDPTGFIAQGGKLSYPKKSVLETREPTGFVTRGGKLSYPKIVVKETPQYGDLGEELRPSKQSKIIQEDIYSGKQLEGPKTENVTRKPRIIQEEVYHGREPIESRTAKTSKEVRVIPETTYQGKTRGIQGPPRKVTEKVGEELNPQSVTDMQANKERAYRLLESKRSGGGYGSETTSPEVAGRQAFARGTRIDQEAVLPEVGPLNKEASKLIPLSEAIGRRIDVAGNKNLEGLGDMIYDVPALMEPDDALPVMAVGRRILGTDTAKNALAQQLYNLQNNPVVNTLKNKYGSALANAVMARMFSGKDSSN